VANGVVAALAIAAAAVGFAASRGGDDGGTATAGTAAGDHTGHDSDGPSGTDAPTTSGVPAAAQPASADRMTAIAAGSYPLGAATASAEAAAAQTVSLQPFYVDTFEVTNAEYDRFVQSQGAPAPTSWSRTGYAAEKAEHPVIGVDWGWAQAYCIALSKRLPREAEWEAAARGPEGLLYPWGASPDAVDLDTPGSKPVGSEAANVSVFGVHDTVGSAWEWVDEPYVPVGPTQRVRRGGEYGRVRGGSAMRQAVEIGNESAIAETGFRCAADTVDPAVAPGQFSSEHPTPEAASETTVASTNPAGGAVLVDDTFENPKSGWADKGDGVFKVGYHAPTWYHLDATQPGVQVVALGGFQYADVSAEAKVYVDKIGSETGRFRYGLVFRAEGPDRAPPGAKGPNRPEDFYAFVVEPRAGRWEVVHEDTLPMRRMADGALPAGFKGFDSGAPDVLKADMRGSAVVLSINGQQVGTFDTRGYHLSGDVGFYLETFDEQKAHVHFDELDVTALGPT
jgi:formylglycine-generating enzyme required for sulfatase activity